MPKTFSSRILSLDVHPDVAVRVQALARQRGVAVSRVLRDALLAYLGQGTLR